DTGTAYVWGSNDSQQLGPEAVVVAGQTYCYPHPINGKKRLACRTVICGPNHTIVKTVVEVAKGSASVVHVYGNYDWKPDRNNAHEFDTCLAKQNYNKIDTTYDNRVVIATKWDRQLKRLNQFILGKHNGSEICIPIDIPIGCSLFDVCAKYCGYNRTFESIVDSIETSISLMESCSQSDEEIYWSEGEEDNDLVTEAIGSHVECKSTGCCERNVKNKEFWRICEQNMINESEIEINAYSYDTIKAFLKFLYGLRPEVNDQNCRQLLGLAEEYGERGLEDIFVALVSAHDLESIARNVLKDISVNLDSNQTLNEFLSKTSINKRPETQLKANDGFLIVEGIGAIGALKVTVSSGKKSLTISNVYGLGAGAVQDINGGKNGRKNVDEKQEVKTITEPLYKKYMKSLSTKESSNGLLVLAEGLNAGEAVIATREGWLDVKGASGFKLGSYTEISTSG
ncbi:unnamed protein product, partial [Medioppia subpectinata]